jgi:hypothetical protein
MILVATWRDGVFAFGPNGVAHELAGESVAHLTLDAGGAPLAIVGEGALYRREPNGEWTRWVAAGPPLSCCVATGETVFAGTSDAKMVRIDRQGRVDALAGFEAVPGRARWYAGSMIVDGRRVGPPLGVRSIAATCDGAVLLANVHVGGIPRSLDGGLTWQPTLDIDCDAHQVCAHPSDPARVAAATAAGLAISRDAGRTWQIETEGLHARHCTAVAFVGDDLVVSAAADPFAAEAGVYRRRADREGLQPVLPHWTDRLVDTHAIAARGATAAMADGGGHLYVSRDHGRTWIGAHAGLPAPSGVVIASSD